MAVYALGVSSTNHMKSKAKALGPGFMNALGAKNSLLLQPERHFMAQNCLCGSGSRQSISLSAPAKASPPLFWAD